MKSKIENTDDLIEVMQYLADNGQYNGIGFDMRMPRPSPKWSAGCCIGGWINLINGTDSYLYESLADVAGCSISTASEICYPGNRRVYEEATAADAVKVLTALRDTGKVIWSEIFPLKTESA